MKKILLFTGAGMSVPMGLPAAVGFAKTIKKCDSELFDLLNGHLNTDANDIEKILYVIEEFVNGSKFYRHILNKYNTPSYPGYKNFIDLLKSFESKAFSFQQVVKHDIFRILQKFDSEKAFRIYMNLLKSFKMSYNNFSLSVFTTNYDLIFEDFVSENSDELEALGYTDFFFGFTTKYGKMVYDKNQNFKWDSNIIEYNKVHGSLDWSKDNKGLVVKTGAITLPAVPDEMPLLYPGYKGTPTDEPFISMHNKLYLRLIECDYAYVVGFAFRDPYINSIFEFALRANPDLKIGCYNLLPLNKLPDESNIKNFVKNNPDQFEYLSKGIEDSENPLDIPPF
jgi:hypothetical protein